MQGIKILRVMSAFHFLDDLSHDDEESLALCHISNLLLNYFSRIS